MFKQTEDKKKAALRRKYFDLKRTKPKSKKLSLLKKDKWSFLLPGEEEQERVIKKFELLLKSNRFKKYINSQISREDSCVYVTEVRNDMINLYVTTENLLDELCDEIKEKISNEAISFLVLKGKYSYKGKSCDLRIGAYGVPCHKLTKSLIK